MKVRFKCDPELKAKIDNATGPRSPIWFKEHMDVGKITYDKAFEINGVTYATMQKIIESLNKLPANLNLDYATVTEEAQSQPVIEVLEVDTEPEGPLFQQTEPTSLETSLSKTSDGMISAAQPAETISPIEQEQTEAASSNTGTEFTQGAGNIKVPTTDIPSDDNQHEAAFGVLKHAIEPARESVSEPEHVGEVVRHRYPKQRQIFFGGLALAIALIFFAVAFLDIKDEASPRVFVHKPPVEPSIVPRSHWAPFVDSPIDEPYLESLGKYELWVGRGMRYWNIGDYNLAANSLAEAVKLHASDVEIVIIYADSVRLSSQKKDYALRLQHALDRLDMLRAGLKDTDPRIVPLQLAQGRMLAASGDSYKAAKISHEVADVLPNLKDPGLVVLSYYLDIAESLQLVGTESARKEAEIYLERAIEIAEVHPTEVWCLHWCKAYLAWMRQTSDPSGIAAVSLAIKWSQDQPLPNLRTIAHLRAMQADMLELNGQLPEAKNSILLAREWAEDSEDQRAKSIWGLRLASILTQTGDDREANTVIEDSIRYELSQTPKNERAIAIFRSVRAVSLLNLDDLDEALLEISACIEWGESKRTEEKNRQQLANWYLIRSGIYRWLSQREDGANEKQPLLEKSLSDVDGALSYADSPREKGFVLVARANVLHESRAEEQTLLDLDAAEELIHDHKFPGSEALSQRIQIMRQEIEAPK